MGIVSVKTVAPKKRIATTCTPPALRKALRLLLTGMDDGVWLVGGTALAGYYAAHRRSDDLDLFAKDADHLDQMIRHVRSLQKHGALLKNESRTPAYYRAYATFEGHKFTIDVVLDELLHSVGKAIHTDDDIWIPDLATLFATKVATLVSRCSEKDLFDLAWIFGHIGGIDVEQMVETGSTLDGGINAETLLYSIQGAALRKKACGFVLGGKAGMSRAYKTITTLQQQLIDTLFAYLEKAPPSEDAKILAAALREQKKLR